jgi:hypothetical protein
VGDRGEYTATYVPVSGAENYNPLTARVTLDITKAPLTITGADVAPRAYKEGNRSAEIQRLTFRGLVNGETLTIGEDYFATGAFSDENAGENKTVTVTPFLADNDKAGNYRLADSSFQTTGTISKAPWDIQVTGVPDELTYGDTFGWASLRARLLLLLPGTSPDRRQVDHLVLRNRGALHAGGHTLCPRLRDGRALRCSRRGGLRLLLLRDWGRFLFFCHSLDLLTFSNTNGAKTLFWPRLLIRFPPFPVTQKRRPFYSRAAFSVRLTVHFFVVYHVSLSPLEFLVQFV